MLCGFRDSSERVHAAVIWVCFSDQGSGLRSHGLLFSGFAILLRSGMGLWAFRVRHGFGDGHMVVVLLHYTMLRNLSRVWAWLRYLEQVESIV